MLRFITLKRRIGKAIKADRSLDTEDTAESLTQKMRIGTTIKADMKQEEEERRNYIRKAFLYSVTPESR